MNPPDYYPVPAEVLEVAERAFKKYLASDNPDTRVCEFITDMLMGCDWISCNSLKLFFTAITVKDKEFLWGVYQLLPSSTCMSNKKTPPTQEDHMCLALQQFKKYLDEPS